jgi:hypothetical protein
VIISKRKKATGMKELGEAVFYLVSRVYEKATFGDNQRCRQLAIRHMARGRKRQI